MYYVAIVIQSFAVMIEHSTIVINIEELLLKCSSFFLVAAIERLKMYLCYFRRITNNNFRKIRMFNMITSGKRIE